MQIDRITVRAGRVLPHPLYSYSNIKCDLEYSASLEAGEDPNKARAELQAKAESDVENHANELKESIRDYQGHLANKQRISQLQAEIDRKNKEIEDLKSSELSQPLLAFGT